MDRIHQKNIRTLKNWIDTFSTNSSDKIFVYEKEVIDGEVVQTVEIFYNFLLNTKELNTKIPSLSRYKATNGGRDEQR